MRAITLGTRGSGLALAQTTWVREMLEKLHPKLRFETRIIKTKGDRIAEKFEPTFEVDPVFGILTVEPKGLGKKPPVGKGLFTKELEVALLRHKIDIAVHSLKDLPTDLPAGLTLGAIPKRAAAHDVALAKSASAFADIPREAVVATGSPRRRAELLRARPDLRFEEIRGNIDTRIRRLLATPGLEAITLAAAGLDRLRPDTGGLHIIPLEPSVMLPAPGQGALALQCRAGDTETVEILRPADHFASRRCVETERAFLAGLGGGCQMPLGALATYDDGLVRMRARHHRADGCAEYSGAWPANEAPAHALALARSGS